MIILSALADKHIQIRLRILFSYEIEHGSNQVDDHIVPEMWAAYSEKVFQRYKEISAALILYLTYLTSYFEHEEASRFCIL